MITIVVNHNNDSIKVSDQEWHCNRPSEMIEILNTIIDKIADIQSVALMVELIEINEETTRSVGEW